MHGNGPGKFKGTHYPIRFSPERNAAWLDGGSREECRSDSGPVRLCESVVRLGLADGICYWVTSSRLAVRLLVNTIPDLSPICQTLVISRSRHIDQHFEDDYIMFYGAFFDSRFSTKNIGICCELFYSFLWIRISFVISCECMTCFITYFTANGQW